MSRRESRHHSARSPADAGARRGEFRRTWTRRSLASG
jgi:hypothetical protein